MEKQVLNYYNSVDSSSISNVVDICGVPLAIGDKVSAKSDQLIRIGLILGFTKTKVIVGFDYTANGYSSESDLVQVKLSPYNLTKLINQNIGLQDYLKHPSR